MLRDQRTVIANRQIRHFLSVASLLFFSSGCVVPQPRGLGRLTREVEPRTGRGYWRYLPKPYVDADEAGRKARRWPLVVSFHGMKPFDNARPQALEWEQEADRYGFIAIAPELHAPDVLREFPIRNVTPAFRDDEEATLAILNHVYATVDADPSNVLATSWSSGGYMAHFMANRHPDRFTAVCVRQSNFSAGVMDDATVARARYHPVLIINTENDFAICVRESAEAVHWYESRGYQNVWWIKIKGLGHERTPDLAAAFFGRVAGVRPNAAPTVLAQRQAIDGNAAGLAFLSGNMTEIRTPAGAPEPPPTVLASLPPTPARRNGWSSDSPEVRMQPESAPVTVRSMPRNDTPTTARIQRDSVAVRPQKDSSSSTATRVQKEAANRDPNVKIRLSSAIGIEPLLLGFSVECPSDWMRSADFLWTLDGAAICNGINGQKTLTKPGVYELAVLVVTTDGTEHRAQHSIRVLPKLARGSTDSGAGSAQ